MQHSNKINTVVNQRLCKISDIVVEYICKRLSILSALVNSMIVDIA